MAYSTKRKRGRPKVATPKWDYGNAYVQARADRFRMFGGDASKGTEFTCAGRLMLVGAFDGLEQDAQTYLAAILEYEHAYWCQYGGQAPGVAGYDQFKDRSIISGGLIRPDPFGEWFEAMDTRLLNAGRQARSAVHAVSVDRHWFPDEDVNWAARIINTAFLRKKLPVAGEIACDSDWAMLALLREGVRALVEPQKMRRAA